MGQPAARSEAMQRGGRHRPLLIERDTYAILEPISILKRLYMDK